MHLFRTSQRKAKAKSTAGLPAQSGFTLVEMIVSVGLFAVVMLVCVSTLLALVAANRKAQALQTVMNNLEITLDSMARTLRVGSEYYCNGLGPVSDGTRDCPSGDVGMAFVPYGADPSDLSKRWVYVYNDTTKTISRSEDGGGHWSQLTGPEISIDTMRFFVNGTTRGDTEQPRVIIDVSGSIITKNLTTKTDFHLQVTAEQRLLDL